MNDHSVSSKEIEALLEATKTGLPPADRRRSVELYDFAHPDKLSKDQLRALEMIYLSCARGIAAQLSTLLRASVIIELEAISETSYGDFFGALQDATVISLVKIDPLVGRALVTIDPETAFSMIDRLLGGPGYPPAQLRDLTEVEKGLTARVMDRVMSCFADAWMPVVAIEPSLDSVVDLSASADVAPSADRLLLARCRATYGSAAGDMQFGIPFTALDPILGKLSSQLSFAPGRRASDRGYQVLMMRSLDRTDLDVRAELGRAVITMRELLDLQVGDVICLDRAADGDLDLLIGAQVKFRCRPGRVGRRIGVRITEVVGEEA